MKARAPGLLVLSAMLTISICFNNLERAYPQTKPTLSQAELDLLNEINQARARPQLYATYLQNLKPRFKGKEYRSGEVTITTKEGWSAVEDAIEFLRKAKPIGPLLPVQGLCLAALAHVKDQSSSGATGHAGVDSSLIEQRAEAFGTWQGGIGENLCYGDESARDRLLTWLIDDGVPSRGHRNRLMSESYKVAGVSCGRHPEYGTMCVVTVAGGFTETVAGKPVEASTKKPVNSNQTQSNRPESNRTTTNSNSNGSPKTNKTGTTAKPPKH